MQAGSENLHQPLSNLMDYPGYGQTSVLQFYLTDALYKACCMGCSSLAVCVVAILCRETTISLFFSAAIVVLPALSADLLPQNLGRYLFCGMGLIESYPATCNISFLFFILLAKSISYTLIGIRLWCRKHWVQRQPSRKYTSETVAFATSNRLHHFCTAAFYFFLTWELTHKTTPLHRNTADIEAFFFLNIGGVRCICHFRFNLPAVRGVPEADINRTECISRDFSSLLEAFADSRIAFALHSVQWAFRIQRGDASLHLGSNRAETYAGTLLPSFSVAIWCGV